jgi:hypothetical protein
MKSKITTVTAIQVGGETSGGAPHNQPSSPRLTLSDHPLPASTKTHHPRAAPPAPAMTNSVTDHNTTNCQRGTGRVAPPNSHNPMPMHTTTRQTRPPAASATTSNHPCSAPPQLRHQPTVSTANQHIEPGTVPPPKEKLVMRVPPHPPPRKPQGTHRTTYHPKVVAHAGPRRATTPAMGTAHVTVQRASYPTEEPPPTCTEHH